MDVPHVQQAFLLEILMGAVYLVSLKRPRPPIHTCLYANRHANVRDLACQATIPPHTGTGSSLWLQPVAYLCDACDLQSWHPY